MSFHDGDYFKYIKKGQFSFAGNGIGEEEDVRLKYKLCNRFASGGVKSCRDNPPPNTIGWARCRAGRTDLAHDCGLDRSRSKDEHRCLSGYECYALVGEEKNCPESKTWCGLELPANCPNVEDPFSNNDCKTWIEEGIISKDSKVKETLENYCKKGDNIDNKTACTTDLKNNFPSSFVDIATNYCKIGGNILYKTVCNAGLKEKDRGKFDSQLNNYCSANTDKPECACWKEPSEEEKKILSSTVSGFKKECHRSSCAASEAFKTYAMEQSVCPSLQICFSDIGVKGDVGGNSNFTNVVAKCNQVSNITTDGKISSPEAVIMNQESKVTYDGKTDDETDDEDEEKKKKKEEKEKKEKKEAEEKKKRNTNILIAVAALLIILILMSN